jgi:hypothetical protein
MPDLVESRSDLNFADTPLAFYWEGQRLKVESILARWLAPQGRGFRVKAGGSQVYELFYDEVEEEWHIHVLS